MAFITAMFINIEIDAAATVEERGIRYLRFMERRGAAT
jgi:hypothetical protein